MVDGAPPVLGTVSELSYLFEDPLVEKQLTPGQRRLSDQMVRYWTNFARTGDPTTAEPGPWPGYDPRSRPTMVLDRDCRVEQAPMDAEWAVVERHSSAQEPRLAP